MIMTRSTWAEARAGLNSLSLGLDYAESEFEDYLKFANDKTFKPNLRHKFTAGSGSRTIDLPGERHTI